MCRDGDFSPPDPMRPVSFVLSLPAALLLLVNSFALRTAGQRSFPWPFNPPAHEGYHPPHTDLIQHDAAIQERLIQQPPAGVRKMSDDEGEKFLMEYWLFDEQFSEGDAGESYNHTQKPKARDSGQMTDGNKDVWTNGSSFLRPPFPLHAGEDEGVLFLLPFGHAFEASRDLLSPLRKRSFQCPSGTAPCTSINRPNSCCHTGDTCQLVTDTGLGDVGCCPGNQRCSGVLSSCDKGYGSCPNNPGGGCCIPGFSCVDEGCKSLQPYFFLGLSLFLTIHTE
jgi:hypothetical protein